MQERAAAYKRKIKFAAWIWIKQGLWVARIWSGLTDEWGLEDVLDRLKVAFDKWELEGAHKHVI